MSGLYGFFSRSVETIWLGTFHVLHNLTIKSFYLFATVAQEELISILLLTPSNIVYQILSGIWPCIMFTWKHMKLLYVYNTICKPTLPTELRATWSPGLLLQLCFGVAVQQYTSFQPPFKEHICTEPFRIFLKIRGDIRSSRFANEKIFNQKNLYDFFCTPLGSRKTFFQVHSKLSAVW